jgi:hypothetical protein
METIDTCKAELDNYRNTREQVRNSSSLTSRDQAARNRKRTDAIIKLRRNTREQGMNNSSLTSREQAARNRKKHSKSGGNGR